MDGRRDIMAQTLLKQIGFRGFRGGIYIPGWIHVRGAAGNENERAELLTS